MKLGLSFLTCVALGSCLLYLPAAASEQARLIPWSALRPADQSTSMPLLGVAIDHSRGEALAWHDEGQPIRLTGFVLPIDHDDDFVYEFLLFPWAGACSHMAPPPPNQLVHVFPDHPFRISRVYDLITITGALRPGLDKTQLFMMDGVRVLEYGYSVSHAKIAK